MLLLDRTSSEQQTMQCAEHLSVWLQRPLPVLYDDANLIAIHDCDSSYEKIRKHFNHF